MAVSVLFGCASRYSVAALRALNASARIVGTCVRHPALGDVAEVYAHNESTGETVSDGDWDKFEEVAREANTIYRFEPEMASADSYPLPWPYQDLTCRSPSSSKVPAVPPRMWDIPVSYLTRDALVATLIARQGGLAQTAVDESAGQGVDRRFLAQFARVYTRPPTREQFEGVAQILRDAIRKIAPTVAGPGNEEVSVIDTKTGQVLGGFAAGASLSVVPGGTFIADGVMSQSPGTTREFIVGEKLGEVGSGLGQMLVGGSLVLGGGGASLTGGGAVAGVPVCIAGVGLAVNGAVTFFHGGKSLLVAICHWKELPTAPATSAPGSSGSGAGPATAPAASPPKQAAAAVAAKPASSVPPKTTTTTRYKDGSGPTTTTTRSSSGTTTTTRTKPAPSGQGSQPVAKGAKRGPKTDPDAPHNAAVRKEAAKLEAEGYDIVAGGGKREQLVDTKGGIKSGRRPDIIYQKPGEPRCGRNVGKTNADGTPVKREKEALDDLNKRSKVPTDFVPYDR